MVDDTHGIRERIARVFDRIGSLLDLNPHQLAWRMPVAGANSLYGIAIHVLGAIDETMAILLHQPSSRPSSEREFAATGSPEELRISWLKKRQALLQTLQGLSESQLLEGYVHPRKYLVHPDEPAITGYALLLNLLQHLQEHLGQAQIIHDWIAPEKVWAPTECGVSLELK